MLSQIQRFGGAMFTPVLLFPFAGIVVGIAIMLRNPMFVGEALTAPDSLFAQIVHIIEEGGWTVFRNMPVDFRRRSADRPGETGPGPGLSGGAGELSHLELLYQRHGDDLGPLLRRRFFR